MTEFTPQFDHERYDELCALATSGVLTSAESELLARHLDNCAECREAFAQYKNIATDGMPYLADHFAAPAAEAAFDESSALDRLMQAAEKAAPQPTQLAVMASKRPVWHQPWVRGLAAASLVAAVGGGAFWVGAHSATNRLRGAKMEWRSAQSSLEQAIVEKQALEKTIEAGQQQIALLEQQAIEAQNDETKLRADANASTARLASMTDAMNAAKKQSDAQLAAVTLQRDANAGKLRDAEKMYQTVQEELTALQGRHQQDMVRLASLETRVDSLTDEFSYQNKRAKTDEQYLSADKDIRDLIGARNLYIADIMDVNENGQSRKPFGRIFYTKTKSLIFYAYDLDGQPGVRLTSTFQVWGRTSASDSKPINLGILYMDSKTNRRWTLRVDNPEQLAKLDAVFVTIEPHEQTDRPTGKPFLYASLQRVPNHP